MTEVGLEPISTRRERIGLRLSIMMFLQFAIRGVWMPYLTTYLIAPHANGGIGFTGGQAGWIIAVSSLGALTAPLVAGQVADRYLNAERALALLIFIAGVTSLFLARATTFHTFLVLSVVNSIAYMPTISLSNSLSFSNLDHAEKQYPVIRAFGSVGWIIASSLFTMLWLRTGDPKTDTARIADSLLVAGAIGIGYAIYAMLALPATPPKRDRQHPFAFARAFVLLKHPGFLIVMLAALPIAMIHQAYSMRVSPYLRDDVHMPLSWIGPALSLGQWLEIGFLFILGGMIKRIGYRGVLLIGCLAQCARFTIFATTHSIPLIVLALAIHGLCYAAFFAAAFLYVERVAPPDIRHSAQTVFGIMILGLGPVAAGLFNQFFDRFVQANGAQEYHQFWMAQAAAGLGASLLIAVAFPRQTKDGTAKTPRRQEEKI
jgi:nucleoside transporter